MVIPIEVIKIVYEDKKYKLTNKRVISNNTLHKVYPFLIKHF